MMIEEQQKLVAFLEEKIVSLRFAVRQNAFEKIRPELKHELDCAEIALAALAALTQPAIPDLKLPDLQQIYSIYCTPTTGSVNAIAHMEGEILRLNAPHTAPIEPICATGGAEWVKVSERMPVIDKRTWRTPLPVLVLCELGVIPAYARTYTTIGGEKKVGFMASLTLGNARGKHPESLYSSEVLTQVTMWRDMPAAPEAE